MLGPRLAGHNVPCWPNPHQAEPNPLPIYNADNDKAAPPKSIFSIFLIISNPTVHT